MHKFHAIKDIPKCANECAYKLEKWKELEQKKVWAWAILSGSEL